MPYISLSSLPALSTANPNSMTAVVDAAIRSKNPSQIFAALEKVQNKKDSAIAAIPASQERVDDALEIYTFACYPNLREDDYIPGHPGTDFYHPDLKLGISALHQKVETAVKAHRSLEAKESKYADLQARLEASITAIG